MPNTFKIGDIVRLKSGGPKMSVANIHDAPDRVFCEWFGTDGTPMTRPFHADTLEYWAEVVNRANAG